MGRQHCHRCRRWRPGSDFTVRHNGVVMERKRLCDACRRTKPRPVREHDLRPRPDRRKSLPVEPLLELLERRVQQSSELAVARTLHRDARVIRRIRNQERVHLATADYYAMALGSSLNELYPE